MEAKTSPVVAENKENTSPQNRKTNEKSTVDQPISSPAAKPRNDTNHILSDMLARNGAPAREKLKS